MESRLDQDLSCVYFYEDRTSNFCIILLTDRQTDTQTNGHEFNNSLAEVTRHQVDLISQTYGTNNKQVLGTFKMVDPN